MKKLSVILTAILLTGCAAKVPYGELYDKYHACHHNKGVDYFVANDTPFNLEQHKIVKIVRRNGATFDLESLEKVAAEVKANKANKAKAKK